MENIFLTAKCKARRHRLKRKNLMPTFSTWTHENLAKFAEESYERNLQLEEALAQPEHDPMHPEIKKLYEDFFDECFRESTSAQHQPLTNEQIDDIFQANSGYGGDNFHKFAQAIELHHGIMRKSAPSA